MPRSFVPRGPNSERRYEVSWKAGAFSGHRRSADPDWQTRRPADSRSAEPVRGTEGQSPDEIDIDEDSDKLAISNE